MVNEKSKILKKVFSMVPLSQKTKQKNTHAILWKLPLKKKQNFFIFTKIRVVDFI